LPPADDIFAGQAFARTEQALGKRAAAVLAASRVAVVGVGGVGGWCAEALVRTGVGTLVIVDPDRVAPSNVNRQIMATSKSVGELKVAALEKRLLEINPGLRLEVFPERYSKDTAASFGLERCGCIVDAIDSVDDKADLIAHVTRLESVDLFSSMGAALRKDPFAVAKDEFWNIKGDALARSLRSRFRKSGVFPGRGFMCVYSSERPFAAKDAPATAERRAYGSLVHVSAVFGFALAGMVIDKLVGKGGGE
jgi:tRNA A37 threonylcarbamoyladenosine dehydratase